MLGKNKMSMCFYELDKDIPKKLSMNKRSTRVLTLISQKLMS